MPRPHVVVLIPAFHPFVGGAEIATEEVLRRVHDRFRVTVITARLTRLVPARETHNGISVIRVGVGCHYDKWWLVISAWWHVWWLARTQGVSLVWAVMASYGGAAARVTKAVTGISYILTLQEGDALSDVDRRVRYVRRWFKKIFQGAQGIQVIAPFLEPWARTHGAASPIVVIPNGVSCEQFMCSREEAHTWRGSLRHELGISQDAPVVLTVSRLVKKNGLDDFIDAVAGIPAAHGIIVGAGPLRDALEKRACAAGGRIHFVGAQPQTELKKYAAASDVFCRPSLSEGLGIAFLEAMCMKLPIVATDVGGIPSIIRHGENGYLVKPHDPAALKKALVTLLDDPEQRARFSACAHADVRALAWDTVAEHVITWIMQHM